MRKLLFWAAMLTGAACAGIFSLQPQVCHACTTALPPPSCSINLSGMTVRQGDDNTAWWEIFAPRDEQTLFVHMGLNYNNGANPVAAAYRIEVSDPAVGQALPPESQAVAFQLAGSGTEEANDTRTIQLPYAQAGPGDITVTARLSDTNDACVDLPPSITTRVRVNQDGPTMWPITPRTCPKAGEKPTLRFGVRNPGSQARTYAVVARALNPYGGEVFKLGENGAAEATLPPVTLGPGETAEIEITCETFGFCLTGGENQIEVELTPLAGSDEAFGKAFALSNVTIKDPAADCNEINDYWFIMPPLVLGGLIGAPATVALLGGGYALRRRWKLVNEPGSPGHGRPPKPPAPTLGDHPSKGGHVKK